MLRPYVEKVVGDYLGIAPGKLIVNDDGSIPITAGSADYTIRLVEGDPNVLQVYSVVLQEVEKSPELFEALNAINRDLFFTRLFWLDDKRVIAGIEMIPESADKEEIANACKSISWAADKYDTELHGKFGGKMARADEPQPPDGEKPVDV